MVKDSHSNERNIHHGQPAHRIYFLPAIKICNLLPIDLNYNMLNEKGRIGPGATAAVTGVSCLNSFMVNCKRTRVTRLLTLWTRDFIGVH